MVEKNIAVFGMYPRRASCEYALSALKVAGFRDTDISVVLQENPETKNLGGKDAKNTPEDARQDASSRAVFGGALGWLGGTGAVVAPGLDRFLIAGPMAPTLSAITANRAPGGLAEALSRLGISEHTARQYQMRIENGDILMSVNCSSRNSVNQAKRSFVSTGAEDIATTEESIAD